MADDPKNLNVDELGNRFAGDDGTAREEALGELVRRYKGEFGAFVRRYLAEKLIDELLQDHALKMWKSRETFDPAKGDLRQWAWVVLRGVVIDHGRKQDKLEFPDETEDPGDESPEPIDEAILRERSQIVNDCMDRLSAEDRQLLMLHVYEGFTFQEIANQRGLTLSQASSRFYQARNRLADCVGEHGLED